MLDITVKHENIEMKLTLYQHSLRLLQNTCFIRKNIVTATRRCQHVNHPQGQKCNILDAGATGPDHSLTLTCLTETDYHLISTSTRVIFQEKCSALASFAASIVDNCIVFVTRIFS